jgi:hypothetical protein
MAVLGLFHRCHKVSFIQERPQKIVSWEFYARMLRGGQDGVVVVVQGCSY